MPDLFTVPFTQLTFDALERFLAGAEPEPLLWEAKGGDPNPHEIRRQCGGFANSDQGGYLILGASQRDDGWALDGMLFADREPHRYVSSCLREGVRPLPRYDVRSFNMPHARQVVVIEVAPLLAGPCIVRGSVFERVAGATVSVKDPTRLADLFARGQQAHERAATAADRELLSAIEAFQQFPDPGIDAEDASELLSRFVAISVAPVTPHANTTTRVFRESTRDAMLKVIGELSRPPHPLSPAIWPQVAQHRRLALAQSALDYEPDWVLSAAWTGAVSVAVRMPSATGGPTSVISDVVVPAYQAAGRIASHIGGSEVGYVRFAITDPAQAHWGDGVRIARGPQGLGAEDLDTRSLERELSRAIGIDNAEPEEPDR